MNRYILFLITFIMWSGASFAQNIDFQKIETLAHPRLLLLKAEEKNIKKFLSKDVKVFMVNKRIIDESDKIIEKPALTRKMTGRRLLSVSRDALQRIYYLSYAYRITKNQKYLDKAEQELLAVCAFSDWNPSHFLDVAEMTMGVAIGYDWLYNNLSNASRKTIANAIIEKGLKPSLDSKYNSFLTSSNNWNQVCNAGMLYGAIATYETDKDLAKSIIERSIESVKLPMKDYGPDGAYPEGYGYWSYGTSFNIMLIDALEKLFGHDFELSKAPGFLKTANYYMHMVGSSKRPFNYSDSGIGVGLDATMFWFAKKNNDRSILYTERDKMNSSERMKGEGSRLLPSLIIWNNNMPLENVERPSVNMWVGQGKTPVALMRSTWDDDKAIFMGIKGGSASVNHAHMDIGSFVVDAYGLRWAIDPGMQDYESLESKGLRIFGTGQNAQRWKVFRMTNYVHNTLTVNRNLQNVSGFAPLKVISTQENHKKVAIELASVYPDEFLSANRYAGIIDNKYIEITDSIKMKASGRVRWNMITPAKVEIINNEVLLTQKDKNMIMVVKGADVKWRTWETTPPQKYDAPMPGTTFVGFEFYAPENTEVNFSVYMVQANNLADFRKNTNK